MCDIIRGAECLVLVIWTREPGRPYMDAKQRLVDWGSRVWSMHPLLLVPRGRPISIYDLSDRDIMRPMMSISRRKFAAATSSHNFAIVRSLVDHYKGSLILGTVDLLVCLIQLLFMNTTIAYLPGDHSYVLILAIQPSKRSLLFSLRTMSMASWSAGSAPFRLTRRVGCPLCYVRTTGKST